MKTKDKYFSFGIPVLPRLDVFSPDIKWFRCEWFERISLDPKIATFKEAFIEAEKQYLIIREEKLKWVTEHLPDYSQLLKETYPKTLEIYYEERREITLNNSSN